MQGILCCLNALSGSVFLTVGLTHLLPDVLAYQSEAAPALEYPLGLSLVAIGFLAILFIEQVRQAWRWRFAWHFAACLECRAHGSYVTMHDSQCVLGLASWRHDGRAAAPLPVPADTSTKPELHCKRQTSSTESAATGTGVPSSANAVCGCTPHDGPSEAPHVAQKRLQWPSRTQPMPAATAQVLFARHAHGGAPAAGKGAGRGASGTGGCVGLLERTLTVGFKFREPLLTELALVLHASLEAVVLGLAVRCLLSNVALTP